MINLRWMLYYLGKKLSEFAISCKFVKCSLRKHMRTDNHIDLIILVINLLACHFRTLCFVEREGFLAVIPVTTIIVVADNIVMLIVT